ncbi:hypothetical protein POVWA2_039240 [Plasmodium ovale wallikeri]|uniref:Uncharacterized protein n=1 Tax=Plasmodium ovale wallikeri TaxID=864142 RepID=A0A1A8Z7B8_PLAOA|nr:hypothetical protein POVWA1_040490 [Plasmodium ovale wallikeri]SBT40225.1 hypothetical protein POVWA2_039240 [Plasmodium ovale wallikeri]
MHIPAEIRSCKGCQGEKIAWQNPTQRDEVNTSKGRDFERVEKGMEEGTNNNAKSHKRASGTCIHIRTCKHRHAHAFSFAHAWRNIFH